MSEPEAKVRHKRGDVREDGKVFFRYRKDKEEWVSPEHLDDYRIKERDTFRNLNSPSPNRSTHKRGYTREDGMVFWSCMRGKEYWVDQETFQKKMEGARKIDRKRAGSRKKWLRGDREVHLAYMRKWVNERRRSDPLFSLASRLRNRMLEAFRIRNTSKPAKFESILGVTVSEAKAYLEAQFSEGMSWENFGKWHVDHVIPLSSAKTSEELVALCRYSNLQPLWARDNIRKGAKMPDQLKRENA